MFGPERTATGRPRTSVESRSPVAGSRPFVRLSTGAVPGSARRPRANARLGTATTTSSASASGASATARLDPAEVAVAGSAGCARSRRSPAPAPRSRHASVDLVPAVARADGERRPPRAAADDDDLMHGVHEVDRRPAPFQLEALAQLVLDPVAVVARHQRPVVDEDRKRGGRLATCVPYRRFSRRPAPPAAAAFAQLRQHAVQLAGRDAAGASVE